MINSETIKNEIRKFIIKTSYVSEEALSADTLIFAQGIMDSMGFMSLISFLDESFHIKVNDNELVESNFESINAIANYVQFKLNTN